MKHNIITLAFIILTLNTFSCTLFWSAKNDQILCAKNMDWSNQDARILFIPATEGKFGRVYFGVESGYGFTNTSGMNEMGLWYAGASLPERNDIYNTYNKPRWDYELSEKIMEECSSVDEAIEIFSYYWEPHWNGHILIADKFGNCVAVEYGENDVIFIRNNTDHQVATNFYLSDSINSRWYNCYRYNIANEMLENNSEISFDLFRNIASETSAQGEFQTVLSTLHDLKNGEVQIYRMHNFNELVSFKLSDELEKGKRYLKCSDYFNELQLNFPLNNSEINGEEVTFSWFANSAKYELVYSKNYNFDDAVTIEICNYNYSNLEINASILAIIFALWILLKHKKWAFALLTLVSLILITACEESEIEPQYSKTKHQITVKGLDSNSKYYWKIESNSQTELKSESVTFKFDTN